MSEGMPHRKAPCNECPWRKDVPINRFSLERFQQLRATSTQPDVRDTAAMVQAAAGEQEKFGCHKGDPGTGEDLACAGWLAVVGWENISIRVAVVYGQLPGSALRSGPNWPELYESYDAMVEAQREGEA